MYVANMSLWRCDSATIVNRLEKLAEDSRIQSFSCSRGKRFEVCLPNKRILSFAVRDMDFIVDIIHCTITCDGNENSEVMGLREFVGWMDPLWACIVDCRNHLNQGFVEHILGGMTHVNRLPAITEYSYWGARYCALFGSRVETLMEMDICTVQKINSGMWISLIGNRYDKSEFENNIKRIQDVLLPKRLWGEEVEATEGVRIAIEHLLMMEDALCELESRRKKYRDVFELSICDIMHFVKVEIRERLKRKHSACEMCLMFSDEIATGICWMAEDVEYAKALIEENLEKRLIRWSCVVHSIRIIGGDVKFSVVLYDSFGLRKELDNVDVTLNRKHRGTPMVEW